MRAAKKRLKAAAELLGVDAQKVVADVTQRMKDDFAYQRAVAKAKKEGKPIPERSKVVEGGSESPCL
jgi:hypothetical protein